MNKIESFDGEYRFLSNFWPSRIKRDFIDNEAVPSLQVTTWVSFPNVEQAYQASKCADAKEAMMFLDENLAPGQAKRLGKRVKLRSDWDVAKDAVMEHWVRKKFGQNPDLAILLLATKDAELIEGNNWGDTYWGVCRGYGQNKLGKILMKIRAELKDKMDKGLKTQKEETMKTTVINIKDAPANWQSDPQYVYIGRPGKGLTGPWGNPHVVDRECPVCNDPPHHKKVFVHSRGTAVEEFRKEMMKVVQDHKLLAKHSIEQLRGKTLVCFCKPLPCHGDVYVEILENVLPDLYQENLEKEQIQKEEKPMLFARDGDGQKYLKHMEEQKAKPKLPDLKNKIVAVTGHRPDKLGGYDRETEQKLIDFATMVLKKLEPLYVITGMALGWDQAVAQACIDLSIPFHAYIPGTWQPNKWRANSKDVWEELMEHAQEIINCDPDERGYAAWKLDHRNKQMVDAAHYVLALWDGSSGGTGNCVAYARTQNKFLMQLWNTWQKGGW